MKSRLFSLILVIALLLFAGVPSALADIMYQYKGPNFTAINGVPMPGLTSHIEFTMTLTDYLPLTWDGLTGAVPPTLHLWSMSDGNFILTPDNGSSLIKLQVVTDLGLPAVWDIEAFGPDGFTLTFTGAGDESISNANLQVLTGPAGTSSDWSVKQVPEPSSLLLLATGVLGVMGLGCRRVRSSCK